MDEAAHDNLLLIVVGASLVAELEDRPLADWLREEIAQRQHAMGAEHPIVPVVCTDVWYLNDASLMARPTIALGRPEVNAATAYFAHSLPLALVVDDLYEIQVDVELIDLHACVWGVNLQVTHAAVEAFVRRYLDDFLRAALELRLGA